MSYWLIVVGPVGGLTAAVFGLIDRLGVGVDEGANLNAPSSLTSGPPRHLTTADEGLAPHAAAR